MFRNVSLDEQKTKNIHIKKWACAKIDHTQETTL
jgi:hypothetical protein